MEGEYINISDVGKLFSSARDAITLRARQLDAAKSKLEEVPAEFNSLSHSDVFDMDFTPINRFAEREKINVDNIIVFETELFECALENDDVAEELKRLMTKVLLYTATKASVFQTKNEIRKTRESYNVRRDMIINRNQEKLDRAGRYSVEFSRQIRENDEILERRKRKLIKSFNKALDRAGSPNLLVGNDLWMWEKFVEWDWAGHDGSRYCCKEQNIMLEHNQQFVERMWAMLERLKGHDPKTDSWV